MRHDTRVIAGVTVAVVVVWLVGAAITRYSVEQMAYLAPIAVVVAGFTIGVFVFWARVVLNALHDRRERRG